MLTAATAHPDAGFGPDTFGLGKLALRETQPLYAAKDSGIEMSFRASKDRYQELIALYVKSTFGTLGPILFSSAFSPFSPQFLLHEGQLVVHGGETLIIIDYRENLYQIVPSQASLMFLVNDRIYLESPDQWGEGYDLSTHRRIPTYSAKNRPFDPKQALPAKRIEAGGKVVENKEAWRLLETTKTPP